jgi:Cu-processing system permease protein
VRVTIKLARYELRNVLRGRWLLAYALFFLLVAEVMLRFVGGSARTLLSLMNVVLLVVPLFSLLFGTMYLYGSREFGRLMLAQPISRRQLYGGLYLGLSVPLALAAPLGITVPFLVHGVSDARHVPSVIVLALAALMLAFIFTGLAFLVAVVVRDRAAGLGVSIVLWLFLAALYDGLVLLAASSFSHYPLDKPMLAAMLLNPIDLARVMFLLEFDVAALMGYTGAVFRQFFGTGLGIGVAAVSLAAWLVVPLSIGMRLFSRKDL